jgi:hypothetical protein
MENDMDSTLIIALRQYEAGLIGPWDLQAVIEEYHYSGFTGLSDGSFIIHV